MTWKWGEEPWGAALARVWPPGFFPRLLPVPTTGPSLV